MQKMDVMDLNDPLIVLFRVYSLQIRQTQEMYASTGLYLIKRSAL